MYAATFNVGSWLETPAKWLRWAMQSNTALKLQDAQYNLQQFWKAIEPLKAKAATSKDWGEILTLDAQSQLCLSSHLQATISELLKRKNNLSIIKNWAWLTLIGIPNSLLASSQSEDIDKVIGLLTRQKSEALSKAQVMNNEALTYFERAKVAQNQAKNAKVVIAGRKQKQAKEDKQNQQIASQIDQNNLGAATQKTLEEMLKADFMGLPVWAWGAGLVALLILIPKPGPSIQLGGQR